MSQTFESICKNLVLHCQEADLLCCLCCENITDACIEECRHRFCHSCIQHNLEIGKPCPICRTEYSRILHDDFGGYIILNCIISEFPGSFVLIDRLSFLSQKQRVLAKMLNWIYNKSSIVRFIFVKECSVLNVKEVADSLPQEEFVYAINTVLKPFLSVQGKECVVTNNAVVIRYPQKSRNGLHMAAIYYDDKYYFIGEVQNDIPQGEGIVYFPHGVEVHATFTNGEWGAEGKVIVSTIEIDATLHPWSHYNASPIIRFVRDPTSMGLGQIINKIYRVRASGQDIPLDVNLMHYLHWFNLSLDSLSLELSSELQIPDFEMLDPRIKASFNVRTLYLSPQQSNLYSSMLRLMAGELDCWNEEVEKSENVGSIPIVDIISMRCPVTSFHFDSFSHLIRINNTRPTASHEYTFSSCPFSFQEFNLDIRRLCLNHCSLPSFQGIPGTVFQHLESLEIYNCQSIRQLALLDDSLPCCTSIRIIECYSLQRITIGDRVMSQRDSSIHRLELTRLVSLEEFSVGNDSCKFVGELVINAPELSYLVFGERSFTKTTMLRIASAFLKQKDVTRLKIGDDSFSSATFSIEMPLLYLKDFRVGRNCVPISSTFNFQVLPSAEQVFFADNSFRSTTLLPVVSQDPNHTKINQLQSVNVFASAMNHLTRIVFGKGCFLSGYYFILKNLPKLEEVVFSTDCLPSVTILTLSHLPSLRKVFLPSGSFPNVKTLLITDVNLNIEFLDEEGVRWEEGKWPLRSMVASVVSGIYKNHKNVLSTKDHDSKYMVFEFKEQDIQREVNERHRIEMCAVKCV